MQLSTSWLRFTVIAINNEEKERVPWTWMTIRLVAESQTSNIRNRVNRHENFKLCWKLLGDPRQSTSGSFAHM